MEYENEDTREDWEAEQDEQAEDGVIDLEDGYYY